MNEFTETEISVTKIEQRILLLENYLKLVINWSL